MTSLENSPNVTVRFFRAADPLPKDFGGGIRRPATVETDSPVFKGYRSVMLYSQLRRRQLPDEAFTLNYLPRVEDLRK